jgi:hypothetical protein
MRRYKISDVPWEGYPPSNHGENENGSKILYDI